MNKEYSLTPAVVQAFSRCAGIDEVHSGVSRYACSEIERNMYVCMCVHISGHNYVCM